MSTDKLPYTASYQPPLFTIDEIASYIDSLQEAMEELSAMLHLERKKMNAFKSALLENDVLKLLNELYNIDKDRPEYLATLEILKECGVVVLIRKVLWGEDVNDWCLSVALGRMIPGFEMLVEKYPELILDEARTVTMKLSNLTRQADTLRSEKK